jgi:hypothetical protein
MGLWLAGTVKTTIDLPDELIEAKKRAGELRRPLRQLIEDGLRAQLAGGKQLRPRKPRKDPMDHGSSRVAA